MPYADSDEDHLGINDDRDVGHWEAIDIADYEYRPDQHTLDALSLFFQNIPDMLDIVEDDIEQAVKKMAIPQQDIDILQWNSKMPWMQELCYATVDRHAA